MVPLSNEEHTRIHAYLILKEAFSFKKIKPVPIIRLRPGVVPPKFLELVDQLECKELIRFWESEALRCRARYDMPGCFRAEEMADEMKDQLEGIFREY